MQSQYGTRNKWLVGALSCGLMMGSTGVELHAQNPPDNGPGGQQRADFRNLSQEQRQELMQKVNDYTREQMLRLMLNNANFTETTLQDAVIAFAKAQDEALQPLRDENRKVMESMNNQAITERQLATLINNFRAAVEDETMRRQTAQTELDAKINYSKQPRLAAVLTLMGLIGDEMAVVNSAGDMGGRGGPGGFGGPGFGGPGGPGGGPGGFGGGPGGGPGGRGGGPGFGGRDGGPGGGANGRGGGRGGRGGGQRGGGGNQQGGNQPGGAQPAGQQGGVRRNA